MQKVFEKIIEKLEEEADSIYLDKTKGRKFIMLDDARKVVQEVAEEYNNGWISVSERLPEEKQQVIVCDDIASWFCDYDPEYGFCIPYYGNTFNCRIFEHVKAWQPKPQPWKGE